MSDSERQLIRAVEALKRGKVTTKQEGDRVHVTIESTISLDEFSEIWKVEEA